MLFNEPKLLKSSGRLLQPRSRSSFSALQRAEIAEILPEFYCRRVPIKVSVLFNEPKLLKSSTPPVGTSWRAVSVLFNEPKLLKSLADVRDVIADRRFSALQRAEIAEIVIWIT